MWEEALRQNTEIAAQFSDPNSGGRNEYLSLEEDYEQATNVFPLPKVPVVIMSAQRPGNDIPDTIAIPPFHSLSDQGAKPPGCNTLGCRITHGTWK